MQTRRDNTVGQGSGLKTSEAALMQLCDGRKSCFIAKRKARWLRKALLPQSSLARCWSLAEFLLFHKCQSKTDSAEALHTNVLRELLRFVHSVLQSLETQPRPLVVLGRANKKIKGAVEGVFARRFRRLFWDLL